MKIDYVNHDVNRVKLAISAVKPSQYPRKGYPEIAFVGRSNVGKSALTNTLINRRNYAYMSSRPGKTQTLNFYNVEDQLYLVDIPGYGYAKVSKAKRETWANMIDTYLMNRHQLKGVVMLVDGRRAPSPLDVQMKVWLNYYRIPTLVVVNKMDKVKRSQWNREVSLVIRKMNISRSEMVLFSAKSRYGRDQVWRWIETVVR